MPPGSSPASKMVTPYPNVARSCAAARPAGPAPITATRRGAASRGDGGVRCSGSGKCDAYRLPSLTSSVRSRFCVSGRMDSTPYCSVRCLFSARMAIGASMAPRRQTSSHGAAQTRPHTDAKGFGARATRYASSRRPSASNCTYRPASVATGQPAWHFTCAFQCASCGSVTRTAISPPVEPESIVNCSDQWSLTGFEVQFDRRVSGCNCGAAEYLSIWYCVPGDVGFVAKLPVENFGELGIFA